MLEVGLPGVILLEGEAVGVEGAGAGAGRGGRRTTAGTLLAGALAALQPPHWMDCFKQI